MNKKTILEAFSKLSNERTASNTKKRLKTLDSYGVKMGDIRKLAKSLQKSYPLALELFESNVVEVKILAILLMPLEDVTLALLTQWAKSLESSTAVDQALSKLVINSSCYEDALNSWYNHEDTDIKYAGYSLFSSYFMSFPLDVIDIELSLSVLSIIEDTILNEPSTIQNAMNNAVVMAGLHVPSLVDKATGVANQIGYILPLRAKNACNIQSASDYLARYSTQPKYSRVAKLLEKGSQL